MLRYLAGLITAVLAGVAGVWLILAPAALGYPGRGVYTSTESRVSLGTGVGLCVIALISAVCWAVAWRRRLRSDGVLPGGMPVPVATVPLEEAPTEVLEPVSTPGPSDDPGLRALLAPLVSALASDGAAGAAPEPKPARPAAPVPAPATPAAAPAAAAGLAASAPAGSAPAGSGLAGSGLADPAPAPAAPVPVAAAGAGAVAPASADAATPFGAVPERARRDEGSRDLAWQDAVLREAAREAKPPLPRRREAGRATAGRYVGIRPWGGAAEDDAEETW